MKREIKFRGKYNDTWVCGSLLIGTGKVALCQIENVDFDNHLLYDVDPETVGQFTGLTDKNGKEIYEGDIVSGVIEEYNGRFIEAVGSEHYTITWDIPSASFIGVSHKHIDNSNLGMEDLLNCEIIGNIHDNPDLLK